MRTRKKTPPASRLHMPLWLAAPLIGLVLVLAMFTTGKRTDVDGDGIPDSPWKAFTASICDNPDVFSQYGEGETRPGCGGGGAPAPTPVDPDGTGAEQVEVVQ